MAHTGTGARSPALDAVFERIGTAVTRAYGPIAIAAAAAWGLAAIIVARYHRSIPDLDTAPPHATDEG